MALHTSQRTNILSLFSGYGGLDLGLKLAIPNARTICYVERDLYASAVLLARMQDKTLDTAPLWSDVRSFDGNPWRDAVDLICGGFPCQDISNAGKRAGIQGERSGLWAEYARIIREVQPRFVFVENVSALLSRGIERVLGDLATLGFDAEWSVFSAQGIGAPHIRERVFIMAYSNSTGRQQNTGCASSLRDAHGWQQNQNHLTKCASQGVGLANSYGQRQPQPEGDHPESRGWSSHDVEEVGVAHLAGLEGRRESIREGEDELPTWPPSPTNPEWERIGRDYPHLKPAVCRVADGSADRLERLRVLGNGVVPRVAAEAWRVLYRRIRR